MGSEGYASSWCEHYMCTGMLRRKVENLREALLMLAGVWLALPAPAQARASTMLTHSPARPSDLHRQLLGLVASSAECIGSFSRAQLTETEGVSATEITPLESRRLRRMWDDRLAWRLRQRPTTGAAEACGPFTTSVSVRSHVPSTSVRSHQELWQSRLNDPRWTKQELWRAEAVAVRGPYLAKSVAVAPVVCPSSQMAADHSVVWAPTVATVATVAAITAATVMQVAEMAAVAVMSEAAKQKRLAPSQAVVTGSANEHVGAHESLEEATSVTAAAVMQAAEMTAVALIKVANKWL